ncbi:hypothetical protein RIVM261_051200 [Rivularia sp. IAM M-261]|nr:hypothetical protein RIVM261_051200 [Rivularia sp. IAM M-261]
MKQQYSLTSIWYWSLNSVAFIVATFGTVQAIILTQAPSPVKIPQPDKEPFNLSFNPYKLNIPNNLNKPNFKLSLLPIPNAETQKCEVFSCLPPNPFQNDDSQPEDLPELNLQQDNYRYTSYNKVCHSQRSVMRSICRRLESSKFKNLQDASLRCTPFSMTIFNSPSSNIESYNLNTNISSSLNRTDIFIPITPVEKKNTPITSQRNKPQTIASGIFQGTYELYSQSSHKTNTPETKPIQQISMTVGDAVYLALAQGADKNAYLVNIKTKPSTLKPRYKWNDVSNINQSKQLDIKLSLTKDTDKKIVRLNELINKQDSRNALNSKITNVVLTYNKLLQSQQKVKISELSLKNVEGLQNRNYRIPLLAAQNEVKARRLELASILEINNIEIIAGEIPVIEPISLEFENLQKIAFTYQPNYLRNLFNFEISQLVNKNKELKAETLKNTTLQLDTHLQNSINYINSIYSQVEGARQAVKLSEQQLNIEQQKFKLGKASQSELINRIDELAQAQNNEVEVTVKYLNALANLDQLLGTTSETFRNQVSS